MKGDDKYVRQKKFTYRFANTAIFSNAVYTNSVFDFRQGTLGKDAFFIYAGQLYLGGGFHTGLVCRKKSVGFPACHYT